MLNGWDILGILLFGVIVYKIIESIVMGVVANNAVKKAKELGTTKDEVLKEVDKICQEAIASAVKILNKKDKEISSDIIRVAKELDEAKEEFRKASRPAVLNIETGKEEKKTTKKSTVTNRTITRKKKSEE